MLRAVIFDFNGVLVDDEPIHLEMFQKVLLDEGLSLDASEYYARYLGMDDRNCFKAVYQNHGHVLSSTSLEKLVQRKARYYRESIEKRIVVFPGVRELLPELSSRFPLGIGSGALRSEIEMILKSIGLRSFFQVIVSTDDVKEGKPDPEVFIKALHLLSQKVADRSLEPSDCLVIEDSKEGIRGAHAAGMKCMAVANSHRAEELTEAETVVETLEGVNVSFLEGLFSADDSA
ncbi:MAG: HAD family hydrolase [Candidatus Binatia bacterium]